MAASLHPQNGRIPARGRDLPPGCKPRPRFPPVFVGRDGDEKHRTPLCPELSDGEYRMLGSEEAIYVYGERWCETCRMSELSSDGSGWTDPRYQRGESA
jgi:hypothetical protein